MLTQPIPAVDPGMPASLRYIQNGDALNTGNHQAQAEDVANAVGHLEITKADKENGQHTGTATFVNLTASGTVALEGATTADDLEVTQAIKTDVGSITRVVQEIPSTDDTSVWSINSLGVPTQDATTLGSLVWPLKIPHGATLTEVTVHVIGAGGHVSLPSGTDRVLLTVGYTATPGAGTWLGTQYDETVDIGEYESAHTIAVSGLSHTIDRTSNRYYVSLRGEMGDDAVVGLEVRNVSCTFTPATYDPG